MKKLILIVCAVFAICIVFVFILAAFSGASVEAEKVSKSYSYKELSGEETS